MLSMEDFPPLVSRAKKEPMLTSDQQGDSQAVATEAVTTEAATTETVTTRRAQFAQLGDLPDELILEILDYLPGIDLDHFHLHDLVSLSLTNRRLHRIVAERLYAGFNSLFCTPYPFMRTVMSDRHLASHVTSISFGYGPIVHHQLNPYHPSIADKQLIKDSLKGLKVPKLNWKQWASTCNDYHVDIENIYATILLYTPNVKSLTIDDGAALDPRGKVPCWLTNFRRVVSGVDLGKIHKFERLEIIRVDVQFLKLRHLAPLFKLRSVRKVTLVSLFEWMHTGQAAKEELRRLFPVGASHVEELRMEMSFVDDDMLGVVISGIKKLKVFEYWSSTDHFNEVSNDYWVQSEDEAIAGFDEDDAANLWSKMAKSLRTQASSLEQFSWRDGIQTEDVFVHRPLGYLKSFVKLSRLEVPMSVLLQDKEDGKVWSLFENLPNALEFLTMNSNQDGVEYQQKCLSYMAKHVGEREVPLREVQMNYHSLLTRPSYDWIGFGKALREQGIVFKFWDSLLDREVDWQPYVNEQPSDVNEQPSNVDEQPTEVNGQSSEASTNSSAYEESLYSN